MNRLVIADDHPIMLEGLKGILRTEFEIAGTASDGRVLLEEAERLKPNLVVLDISIGDMNGIEVARRLLKILPGVRIVFVAQQMDETYITAAFEAGVMGYVSKRAAGDELLEAARQALAGRHFVGSFAIERDPRLARLHLSRPKPARRPGGRITQRQREVLQLIAEGRSTKEIAELLKLSAKTVEFHRAGLMNELGLRSIAELTRYAVAHGIVSD